MVNRKYKPCKNCGEHEIYFVYYGKVVRENAKGEKIHVIIEESPNLLRVECSECGEEIEEYEED